MLLSIIILTIVGFMFGYYWRDIHDQLHRYKVLINQLWLRETPTPDEPTGQVVDPDEYDPVAAAKAEFEARTRKLNDK